MIMINYKYSTLPHGKPVFNYIPSPLTVHSPMTRSVRYQPILHTLYFTLHCARALNNVVVTTVTEMIDIPKYWIKELVSVQLTE